MASKTSRRTILGLTGALLVLLLASAWYVYASRSQLERSLAAALDQKLGVTFSVTKSKLHAADSDMAGAWWVVVPQAPRELLLRERRFEKADKADTDYYREMFREDLAPEISLDAYDLYRAEMPLGAGTICESLNCNIALLTKEGSPDLFIQISKS